MKIRGNIIPTSTVLIFAVMTFLSVEVVMLIMQNRRLQSRLEELTRGGADYGQLAQGDVVAPIRLKGLDGTELPIQYGGAPGKHLLFVFSTTCPHCEVTIPKWKETAGKVESNPVMTVGVCMQDEKSAKEFAASKNLNFPVYVPGDTSFQRLYKISGVPQTILVDGNGKVEKVWVGELKPDQIADLEKAVAQSAP